MNTPESNPRQTRIDEATSRRLAKLRTVPMDMSQLLKAIEKQIPRTQTQESRLILGWLKPIRAVAASLLVFGLIVALVIHFSAGRCWRPRIAWRKSTTRCCTARAVNATDYSLRYQG